MVVVVAVLDMHGEGQGHGQAVVLVLVLVLLLVLVVLFRRRSHGEVLSLQRLPLHQSLLLALPLPAPSLLLLNAGLPLSRLRGSGGPRHPPLSRPLLLGPGPRGRGFAGTAAARRVAVARRALDAVARGPLLEDPLCRFLAGARAWGRLLAVVILGAGGAVG